MTDSVFKGFDIAALMAAAGALPSGQQKAKYCADVAAQLGSNPIYEIQVGGLVRYRTTVAGSLTSSAAGVNLPTQFTEPPTINVADALTGSNAVEVIRNATNSAIEIRTPVKVGGGTGFLTASKALNGTYTVRTSSRKILAPDTLDVTVPGGGGGGGGGGALYSVNTLVTDMTLGNDNGYYIEAAPNTQDQYGPGGKYPYVAIGLNRSNNNSHWPGEYISDSKVQGYTISNTTSLYLLPWYVCGRAAQVANGAANTRAQIRNHTLYGLKSDNTWDTIGTGANPISGSSWHANFRSPGNETYEDTAAGSALGQIRTHTSGEGGGQSLGSIGYGNDGSSIPRRLKWTNHGYNAGTAKNRSAWTAYKGLLYVIEARLILHNPSGTDDRSSAGLMMWMGADWYINSPQGSYLNENCHGRLKMLTNDWKVFSCSDISSSLLTSYPPPGYS